MELAKAALLVSTLAANVEALEQIFRTSTFGSNRIVQLKPDAHPAFGGALFFIRKETRRELSGYLLVPHRAGMTIRLRSDDVIPIGTARFAEPEWSYNVYGAGSMLLAALEKHGKHAEAAQICRNSIAWRAAIAAEKEGAKKRRSNP